MHSALTAWATKDLPARLLAAQVARLLNCSVEDVALLVIALSVNPLESHQGWVKDINETQSVTMNFPIIADADRKVATTYDMLPANGNGARSSAVSWASRYQ